MAKNEVKKKGKNPKKIPQEFENIKIMTSSEIYWSQLSIVRRLFISWMEFILAAANTYGSQSDFVQLFMQIFQGQVIYRFYELLEIFNLPIFRVQSTTNMIFFVQISYMATSHVYFHQEKLQL